MQTIKFKSLKILYLLYNNLSLQEITCKYYTVGYSGYYAPTGDCITAVHITGSRGNSENAYYLVKDYLASVMIFINKYGETIESHNYDPWSNLRNPVDWTFNDVNTSFIVNRGFTGHEHPWILIKHL